MPVWIGRNTTSPIYAVDAGSAQDTAYWYQIQIPYMTGTITSSVTTSHPTVGTPVYRPSQWYWTSPTDGAWQWLSWEAERRGEQQAYQAALAACTDQEAARLHRVIAVHERQTAAARNREALARRSEEEERERRRLAARRAHGLLLEHLTPEQRETFKAHGWFIVTGSDSKTQYRIRDTGHMVANVDVLNGIGGYTHRLCAHVPVGQVPQGDQLLAQKMMLEFSESQFLRIANRH